MRLGSNEILGLPVRLNGIVLGHAVDLILDRRAGHVVGVEVRCGDDEHRFLPLAAARVAPDELVLTSPFTLLDGPQLEFYAENGVALADLRGADVFHAGCVVGGLADVEVGDRGSVAAVLVRRNGSLRRFAADGTIAIGGARDGPA